MRKRNIECRLYVANIDYRMGESDLRELFGHWGRVVDIYFPKRVDNRHNGTAFVEYDNKHSAREVSEMRPCPTDRYHRHLVIRPAK